MMKDREQYVALFGEEQVAKWDKQLRRERAFQDRVVLGGMGVLLVLLVVWLAGLL